MKILVLSDTQIGSGRHLSDTRLDDQEQMLDEIAALAEDCELVLHCGDVFHHRHPSEEARLVFKRFAAKLEDRLAIAAGNHDLRNADLPSALDLYDDCVLVRQPDVRLFRAAAEYPDVTIAFLPWVPLARRVAARNGSREGILQETADLLVQTAAELRTRCDGHAILATHWPITGASLPTGLPVEQLNMVVLPRTELEEQGWDAVFAGDIHVPGFLSSSIVSCGSPWLNDFGEEHVEHGVWLYDSAENGEARCRFHPIADRRFITCDVDLTSERYLGLGLDETDALAAGVATHFPIEDAVLRIRYKATPEQARRVDVAAIKKLCYDAGCSKVYSVAAEIVRGERARVEGVDENLSEMEALDRWIESQQLAWPSGQSPIEPLRALTTRYLEETQ